MTLESNTLQCFLGRAHCILLICQRYLMKLNSGGAWQAPSEERGTLDLGVSGSSLTLGAQIPYMNSKLGKR